MRRLYQIYWKIEALICPNLESSQVPYERSLRPLVSISPRWLDVGCGRRMFPSWREPSELWARSVKGLCGLDPDGASLRDNSTIRDRVCGSATDLPFASATFDLVTANMVVEHLDAPSRQFAEIARVLKPGGLFLFHTPNVFGHPTLAARFIPHALKRRIARLLDGRDEEDVYPTYYRANSISAISEAAARAGLTVRSVSFVSTSAVTAVLAPLAVAELTLIRLLRAPMLAHLRSNIIATLERPLAPS